ncbi:acyl carrier protein [Acutalibacter muris]|jgi:acyl carrier protein|uniref:Acyl carrier protein n=1 Tax=Acutalibacter muris TaxID=1796620 RepID=A0A1Z2XN83_9FIRM|nr:acyl carrier protein [Acutalibacter muris]ANU53424.1 acyl carrier protein [Hungateiclostridiaceae bacterium KB18]ASB39902.1 acyl carrier protein [Acutalibacter muris]MCI9191936.1 acyl carrier protein [Acutalibacter muris]MCI9542569.1 acyl carrier protein [Acutalibacter muris]QQR29191.1 acyl carrier protein [Acutalibacter muris]
MDQREVFDRLNRVFRDVFDDETIRVTPNTTADDIDDWDSLEHITLISAVEREFRMKFKMGEISSMKNVGEMARIVMERAKR